MRKYWCTISFDVILVFTNITWSLLISFMVIKTGWILKWFDFQDFYQTRTWQKVYVYEDCVHVTNEAEGLVGYRHQDIGKFPYSVDRHGMTILSFCIVFHCTTGDTGFFSLREDSWYGNKFTWIQTHKTWIFLAKC